MPITGIRQFTPCSLTHTVIMARSPQSGLFPAQNWPIEQLPGLSADHQKRLKACGITTTLQLLQKTQTPVQKEAIAIQLHIHPQYLTKWIALATLAAIPAVGCMHCGAVLHAGIASPAQLAQTSLPRLHRQLVKLYVSMMQSKEHCPSLDDVAQWQYQARHLKL